MPVGREKGLLTAEEGLREQAKLLRSLGVETSTISFAGGAGGMVADNVSPRATVQLLQGLSKRDDWPKFRSWLPEMGENGTLVGVVDEKSPARGVVFAKTGTLSYLDSLNGRVYLRSKALAGTLQTQSGRELLFAFFVNDVPLPAGATPMREGKVMGQLL